MSFDHINAAIKLLRASPKLGGMQAAPRLEQLALIAASMLQASTGRAEVGRRELMLRHQALSLRLFGFGPSDAEHAELVDRLCASRLLAPAAAAGVVRLNVLADDVRYLASQIAEFSALYPESAA